MTSGFRCHAIEYCLQEAGIGPEQLDYVGFYDKPFPGSSSGSWRRNLAFAPVRVPFVPERDPGCGLKQKLQPCAAN